MIPISQRVNLVFSDAGICFTANCVYSADAPRRAEMMRITSTGVPCSYSSLSASATVRRSKAPTVPSLPSLLTTLDAILH
jgi:hypothetical protein